MSVCAQILHNLLAGFRRRSHPSIFCARGLFQLSLGKSWHSGKVTRSLQGRNTETIKWTHWDTFGQLISCWIVRGHWSTANPQGELTDFRPKTSTGELNKTYLAVKGNSAKHNADCHVDPRLLICNSEPHSFMMQAVIDRLHSKWNVL